jgi:prephenate dehydratase
MEGVHVTSSATERKLTQDKIGQETSRTSWVPTHSLDLNLCMDQLQPAAERAIPSEADSTSAAGRIMEFEVAASIPESLKETWKLSIIILSINKTGNK